MRVIYLIHMSRTNRCKYEIIGEIMTSDIVHFDENMLIGDAADLDAFMEMYGVEAISKEYL